MFFVGIKYDLGPEKVFTVHSSGVFTQDKSCNFPNSKVYMEKMRPGKSVYYEGVFTMRGFTVLYHNGGGGFNIFYIFSTLHSHSSSCSIPKSINSASGISMRTVYMQVVEESSHGSYRCKSMFFEDRHTL